MYFSLQYVDEEITKLKIKKEELWKDISTQDKLMSEAYHRLEIEEMNKEAAFKFTKELQKIVRYRRKLKFEAFQIDPILHSLHNVKQKLDSNEKKYFPDNEIYKEYIYQ
jgi:sulfur relay (sulfurtransferase) DsrC/TusE family protein